MLLGKKYKEALALLEGVGEDGHSIDYYLLLSKAVHGRGMLAEAVEVLDKAMRKFGSEAQLQQKRNEYYSQHKKIENGLEQIGDGQHSTPDVNFVKANTKQLIEQECFEAAVAQLSALSAARKLKTTNILWIGNYLKDLYFAPGAEHIRSQYDDLLFEEMLFYYLKACKLFEPEYKIIQEAKKALK